MSKMAFSLPRAVARRMELLGRLVQAAREEKRMTQQELAVRAGTSRATLHRLEAGQSSVAWGTVMTVCWALGLPTDPEALSRARITELLVRGESVQRVRKPQELDDDF